MSQNTKLNITSPVGRIVGGNLYKPSDRDAEGKPLVVKTGPNAGQPRVNYYFALAIPKSPGVTHWAYEEWGKQIWALGNTAFPNIAQSPAFAWKITDGDSQIPNKSGKKPYDNEGWPGNWIIRFSGGYAPKVYRQEGTGYVQIMEPDAVKPGFYVQVAFTVDGNASQQQPGVYINHSLVCFRGYGPEIVFGPDVNAVGFGAAPLPAGASAVPLAASVPPPLPHGGSVAPPLPPASGAHVSPPIPVMPNPQFMQVPPPMGAPPAYPQAPGPHALAGPGYPPVTPPAPAALPATISPSNHVMTALAQGIPYDRYIASGWTDAQLVQNGYMLA